jgi:hypothetical protein
MVMLRTVVHQDADHVPLRNGSAHQQRRLQQENSQHDEDRGADRGEGNSIARAGVTDRATVRGEERKTQQDKDYGGDHCGPPRPQRRTAPFQIRRGGT